MQFFRKYHNDQISFAGMRIKDTALNTRFVQEHREVVLERAKVYTVIVFVLSLFDLILIAADTKAAFYIIMNRIATLVSLLVCTYLATRKLAWIEVLVIVTSVSRFVTTILVNQRLKEHLEKD